MFQFEFNGRAPSALQLRAKIREALRAGHGWVQLSWGENQITLERGRWGWDGHGWIRRTGGADLARELELAERKGATI